MKKALSIIIFFTLINCFGQTDGPSSSDKVVPSEIDKNKFKAGMYGMYGVNWLNANNTIYDRKSAGSTVGFGGSFENRFNKNLGINYGFEFAFEFYKLVFNDTVLYYHSDKNLINNDEDLPNSYDTFLLTQRQNKPIYLTFPVSFKMQSNLLGYWKFYGKFGMQMDILLNHKVDDLGYNNGSSDLIEMKDMIPSDEMQLFRGSANVSGGFHYYFAGSTALFAELEYHYGFSNVFKDSKSLFDSNNDFLKLNGNLSVVMLKVGILF
jgi:hypothetical protein